MNDEWWKLSDEKKQTKQGLSVCLGTAYLTETENFLLKIL